MRPSPPSVASLLLAVVLGTSQPLHAQPAELRTVTMRLAADDTYRAQPNWEANLRATVATVSAIYERNFQILLGFSMSFPGRQEH